MRLVNVCSDRVPETARTLTEAMIDEPLGGYLLPDRDEYFATFGRIYSNTVARALTSGRVDAWGDPIVGAAVWLSRPALEEEPTQSDSLAVMKRSQPSKPFPPHAAERFEAVAAVLSELRQRARSDRHAYLDSVGVLPGHRRRGIASTLLDAGHAWAESEGLPCALETFDADNIDFYKRHSYEIVTTAPIPGTNLQATAMRRMIGHP